MKGYVALTCVIIMVPLLLLTGISQLFENISFLSISKLNYDSEILKANSQTCIEETVYRIKRNTTFTGNINLNGPDWDCLVIVSNKAGDATVKVLNITATDNNSNERVTTKELDTKTNPFVLSNL